MRSSILLFGSILALAAACGGKTNGGPGGPGGSSGSGSGSGSSGSGSSSGAVSSSGGSGSSSGVTSSSSGGSSGGVTCAPLPGCNSSVECEAPGGCGVCYCENGGWACSGTGCGDDVSDASIGIDSPFDVCPLDPPNPGTFCDTPNIGCGYGSNDGCGESCNCENDAWQCFSDPCTSEDAGEPPDSSFIDASPCPGGQPAANSACDEEGIVCSYFDGCQVNCLCATSGWVCATEGPCSSPPPPGG
jgi:hypothetical protein